MHTEKRELLVGKHEFGRADIGDEHALFNESVRIVVLANAKAGNPPFFVKDRLRLLRFEVERRASLARPAQRAVKRMQTSDLFYALAYCFETGSFA